MSRNALGLRERLSIRTSHGQPLDLQTFAYVALAPRLPLGKQIAPCIQDILFSVGEKVVLLQMFPRGAFTATMARKVIIPAAGAPAIALGAATTTVTFILASGLSASHHQTYILLLIAAVAQVISTCTLMLLVIRHLRQWTTPAKVFAAKPRRPKILYYFILLAVIAAVIEGVALGWSRASVDKVPTKLVGMKPLTFVLLTLGIWAASTVAQIVFFTTILSKRNEASTHRHEPVESVREMSSEMEETSRPSTPLTTRSNPFRETSVSIPSSPMIDTHSLRSSSSFKYPPSARKPLLSRQLSLPRRSGNRSSASLNRPSFDSPSPSRPSQDSGFDSWDTSHIAPAMRETVLHSRPALMPQRQGLEPIPGSRSPSPAKALEGPFYNIDPLPSPPPSPLPQASVSDSRPSSRGRSATTTGTSSHSHSFKNEDHIHPLFRTCSPTPPPTASAGSIVVAAPVAGQTVNEKVLRRMRSSSTPASPSPLVRSESFYDFNTAPTTPLEGVEIEAPPIPNFILAAGERNSGADTRSSSGLMKRDGSDQGTDPEDLDSSSLPGPMPGAISPGLGIRAPPGML